MKDLLSLPLVPGNSVSEIKANGKRMLAELDAKHQAEMKALDENHQENMKTLDEYCSYLDKEIQEAKKNKDFTKVIELMREMNNHLSKLV